jgi:hypothetical protein
MKGVVRQLLGDSEGLKESLQELRHKLDAASGESVARDQETRRRIDAVARKFEETIDRLTDNQEIISGIKAFLRLVQAGDGKPGA